MSVLEKLKDLKRILDRNLATRSSDILPALNDCIKELELEESTKQPTIKPEKEIHVPKVNTTIDIDMNIPESPISEISGKETRDIEKEAKQFLKDNGVSNRKFLKGDKAVNKAIELGFNI